MDYYRCGKILTTHGLKGDVKVSSYTDFDRFEVGNIVYVKHNENYIPLEIIRVKNAGKYLLVGFKDYEDINSIMKFHSAELFVSADMRQDELACDEYYYSDLIGKKVINTLGQNRGEVLEIRNLPQCDYLYVKYNNRNYYVPFIAEFIVEVKEEIIVKEKEGLFGDN